VPLRPCSTQGMDAKKLIADLNAVKPDDIRQRLATIAAERTALMTLLRASQALERGQASRKTEARRK
jgi:hypothetical protein